MIITAPTGLYTPVLPTRPSDPGNITYTISTESPPRSPETFVQLPASEEIRRDPEPVFDKEQKRVFAGELIYDITVTSEARTGSGVRQFEVGEILEFSEEETVETDPYNLDDIELRQDLKVIDYEGAGLSDDHEVYLKLSVKDIMTKNPFYLTTEASVEEVSQILMEGNYHAVPVLEDNKVVGIVSTADVIKYLLEAV